jgi:hypothetical protein
MRTHGFRQAKRVDRSKNPLPVPGESDSGMKISIHPLKIFHRFSPLNFLMHPLKTFPPFQTLNFFNSFIHSSGISSVKLSLP